VIIKDGKGRGYTALVNSDNRLGISAVIDNRAHHVNHIDKEYYTLTINQQATAANDCIGYIKNDNDTDLVIDSIYLYSAAGTLLTINTNDTGTPNSPTTITPVNCNAGAGNTADATCYQGADLDNGGSSLSGGSAVLNWHAPAGEGRLLDFTSSIIMPKNTTATFWVNQNTASVVVGLGMGFHGDSA